MNQSLNFENRRQNQRTNMWNVVAKAGEEKKLWFSVVIPNISVGGLSFITDKPFKVGDRLWFDLDVDPVLPSIDKFKLLIQCEIKNARELDGAIMSYGAIFCDISNATSARLSELIDRTALVYGSYER